MRKILLFLLLALSLNAFAAYLTNQPTTVTLPDGSALDLLASGDEFYNWLHDEPGFTIVQSAENGFFYYAEKVDGEISASQYRVGQIDPGTIGVEKWLKMDGEKIRRKASLFQESMTLRTEKVTRGILNNLCVFIRFNDQEEFPQPRSFYNEEFNSLEIGAVSLQNYYKEVSYEQLTLNTTQYPESGMDINVSYLDSHPRAYYSPYNTVTNPEGYNDSWERTQREHQLLANAVASIAAQVPAELDIDYNDDGYVDNVCFIIRGPHDAWAQLLWAHRWGLYSQDAFINGKQVYDYTFQPENQATVRTLAHEMFHALGAPDLYHYGFDGVSPAGPWDVMEGGFVHMGAHMKYKYGGWLDEIPTITTSGEYSINSLVNENNNAYKILSPNSSQEYFVVEYRKREQETFDRNVPGSGLLIYRINPNLDGNSDGPPDEVYIFRVDGSISENGSISEAFFTSDAGRTEFNDYTNPTAFLSNGNEGGISIYNIGSADEQISFYVDLEHTNYPPSISFSQPIEAGFFPVGDIAISMNAEDTNRALDSVELYIDDELIETFSSAPYTYVWNTTIAGVGRHYAKAVANSSSGLSSTAEVMLNIVDTENPSLFAWFTDDPVCNEFGRGSIPIKVAADFNLGDNFYYVSEVSLNIEQDSFGESEVPGEVSCTINRMEDGAVTDEVLVDLGSFITPMEGRFDFPVSSEIPINGEVVLVMDINSYQNIKFDVNGVTGHSWLTEPDRPWVDAISRGMIGAADISMKLSANLTDAPESNISAISSLEGNYPNPFNPTTTISFALAENGIVNLEIYNLRGQKIKTLLNETRSRGKHSIAWNGNDDNENPVSSGIYFYKMKTKFSEQTKKMILMK